MMVFAVVVTSLAFAMLAAVLVLIMKLHRRLATLEAAVAVVVERPVGLSVDEADVVAELAAQRTAAAVRRGSLLPTLNSDEDEATPRLSGSRIKAAGWAAGASETVRRLRQGA